MLVIDCVVLILAHQPDKMGKLQGSYSPRFQNDSDTTHEVVNIRYLRQNVVSEYQIRHQAICNHCQRGLTAKEFY